MTTEIVKRGKTRINLAIESGPHALLKVTAAARGLSLDAAYTEAARLWNAAHVRAGKDGKTASVPLSQSLSDEAIRNAEIARYVALSQEVRAEIAPPTRNR